MIYIAIDRFRVSKIIVDPDKDRDPEMERELQCLTLAPIKAYAKLLDEGLAELAEQTRTYIKEHCPSRRESMERMEQAVLGGVPVEDVLTQEEKILIEKRGADGSETNKPR
jgi:hypothetical protein